MTLIRYDTEQSYIIADYHNRAQSDQLVIICTGMPGYPKPRDTKLWHQADYDVVIPDYYGYARSPGEFTPMGCVQSIVDTISVFREGEVTDVYGQVTAQVSYKKIIVIGSSFGGWIAAMTPKFDQSIETIGLFYPLLELANMGQIGYSEESNELARQIIATGFAHTYRGYCDNPVREAFERDESDLIPMKNYKHLKNKKVFIAHGTADEVIHHSRSQKFYDQIQSVTTRSHYASYYGLSHRGAITYACTQGMLHRIK